MQKKKLLFTTLLLTLLLLLVLIIPLFGNSAEACHRKRKPHPPLGKTIIKHFVYPDGSSIGAGLEVTIWNTEPLYTEYTDALGTVVFSPLYDGTFTVEFNWQNIHYTETLRINCSKITWEFTNTVPYWTFEKTFAYPDETPIEGLRVTFAPPAGPSAMPPQVGITDAQGKVYFTGLKYCVIYTLDWSWQGVRTQETVHVDDFQASSPVLMYNELPYWTLEKTFYYDTEPLEPISHLTVKLNDYESETDHEGLVVFADLKAGTYTLEWIWGGVTKTEEVIIGYQTESLVVLTNYLEPKSGGRQINKSTLG
jgi:hypothetical protein